MKTKHDYRYLKGSKRRGFLGGEASLWLADDHLLLLKSSGWADRWRESYGRFYFRDIQALLFCEDNRRRNWLIGLLVPTLFFLSMAALFRDFAFLFHLPMALLFLLIMAVHWFKGPTCIAQIQTAVQTTRLPYVRLRTAKKFNKEIIPLIEKEQGQFDNRHRNVLRDLAKHATTDSATPAVIPHKSSKTPPFNNLAHILAFSIFLAQAGTNILAFQEKGRAFSSLETLLFAAGLILITMALYRQSISRIRGALVWITWITFACVITFLILNFGLLIEIIVNAEDVEQIFSNEYEMWRMMARVNPAESPYLRILLTAKIICYGLLGTIGIGLSMKARGKNSDA